LLQNSASTGDGDYDSFMNSQQAATDTGVEFLFRRQVAIDGQQGMIKDR
jgi:hypothetical protein